MSKEAVKLGDSKGAVSVYYKAAQMTKGQAVTDLTYIETSIDRFDKPAHLFQTKEGLLVTFNSSGMLDKKIAQLKAGDIVDIIYTGSTVMKGGKWAGKSAHSFEVLKEMSPEPKKSKKPASTEESF